MTPLARALLGVALGSCLTLFIHPDSRPYMAGLVPRQAEVDSIRALSGAGTGPMVAPGSTAEASLWMQLGCARLDAGQKLSKEELSSLVRLARLMKRWTQPTQFDNAFWPQMEAVFLDQLGDKAGSYKAWEEATKCAWWKDYQSARLLDEADKVHAQLAWHIAGLYYQRRFAVGSAVLNFAKKTIDKTGQESKPDIEFRYATLVNAHLIATGAQSVEILKYAGTIADLAIQPPHQDPITDKAKREKARGRFYDSLNKLGYPDQATSARTAYAEIDSQPALTRQFRPKQTAALWASLALVTASLPDSLLLVALLGALIWPVGLFILRYSLDRSSIAWPPALIFGILLAVGVFALGLPPLAAVVALLCSLFLVFTPKNERSRLPSDLGAIFNWVVGLVAVLFTITVVGTLASVSTPAKLLLPSILQAGPDTLGIQLGVVLIGMAAILFALLLLLAPMWAFGRRVRTPFVLGLALRTFGMGLVIAGLGGAVLLGPLCVYADSKARGTLAELVGNEPLHYYNQFQ